VRLEPALQASMQVDHAPSIPRALVPGDSHLLAVPEVQAAGQDSVHVPVSELRVRDSVRVPDLGARLRLLKLDARNALRLAGAAAANNNTRRPKKAR